MAILLSCQSLSKSFGPRPLFEGVSMGVDEGERLGLIGPNGSGKSTLLKILAGLEQPDTGEVTQRRNLRASYVAQRDEFAPDADVRSAVASALVEQLHDEHEREIKAERTLLAVGFTRFDQKVAALSGGWRKRLAIARALVTEPDLLLMDEPTNHLDLEGVLWLESFLDDAPMAVIVVTHDRYFLEDVCTRVLELSKAYPQGTFTVDGPYSEFLRRRGEFLTAQAKEQQSLATKVREDIRWLSRGAKARRTKAKGRIEEAGQRAEELADLAHAQVLLHHRGADAAHRHRLGHGLLQTAQTHRQPVSRRARRPRPRQRLRSCQSARSQHGTYPCCRCALRAL